MSNTIKERIYDFLKNYPPFSSIPRDELMEISSKVVVQYFEKDTVIFKQGDATVEQIYVVREGAVELLNTINDKEVLVDLCDEGDIFGIRPLVSNDEPYSLTGKVAEEALIYTIPADIFRTILNNNDHVKEFFDTSFAAGVRNPYAKYSRYKMLVPCDDNWIVSTDISEVDTPVLERKVITCHKDKSIKDAALIMRENNVGSIIIIDDNQHPHGIFTDRDLRNKVVTGDISIDHPISNIMSSPVITASPDITYTDIQIMMIKSNIHHICLTEDGTDKSQILGIVSEHDILLVHGNDPSVLIREIQRSDSSDQLKKIRLKAEELLKKYMRQEVSISYVTRIISEINSSITSKIIEISIHKLAEEEYKIPDVRWCWLGIGSQGREEQLLRGDQDNALVFEDVKPELYNNIKNYFLLLATNVNEILNECGFEFCPSDMMARNPKWCLSLDEWKQQFSSWIHTPGDKEVMYSTIFFDFSPFYGDSSLAAELTSSILADLSKQKSFFSFLARNALQNPPPLSFFRNIMVEHNGEHKDQFDIKARAMMPIVDGARVLAFSKGIAGVSNTIKRYQRLAEIEPDNKELYDVLSEQYELLLRFRTMQGLKNNNSGRYFKPDELNKMQRLMLRNSFSPIKDLQALLTTRFQLNLFR